jgi:multidrug efflux system membrane fusion protein
MKSRILLFSTLALAGFLASCSRSAPPPPMTPKVTVATPVMGSVTNWDEYPGHLQAVESVEIKPRVSGYIESIHFQDGAEVNAGDLLFVVDPKPYQAEMDRASAERQRVEIRLELAKNDLQRVQELRGTKAVSEEEFDLRNKAVREADAALNAAKATENSVAINLEFTRIKAPVAGRIGRRLVTIGNLVQGGGAAPATLLAMLVSVDPVYCYFDVEERAFTKYRTLSTEHNTGKGLACYLGLVGEEGFPHAGVVDFFDNEVNRRTGTMRIRAVFANPDRALVSGMFARVRLMSGPPTQSLLVPAVAVSSDQGQKMVMLVNKENMVEPRLIQAGRQQGSMRVVLSGLTQEDRVIVNGLMMARPKAKVDVVDPSAQPPASPVPSRK